MSSEKIPTKASKNDNQRSKTGSPRPPEPNLKCPRCDSPNTKFCYYNNYNLSQPRHFCKTCRRYWTKGGALRNVPVGGGCRKNKKMKPGSRLSDDSKDSGASYDSTGFKFFHGISPAAAAMEFQYGTRLPFSRLNNSPSSSSYNHLFSFGDLSSSSNALTSTSSALGAGAFDMDGTPSSTSLMGFSVPVRQGDHQTGSSVGYNNNNNWGVGVEDNLSMNVHSNLASSIESLSCINQDLHWKLQQQRLAMLYVGENQKEASCLQGVGEQSQNQAKPISFQNLEISNPELMKNVGANNTTEWLFENSFNPTTGTTTASSNSNGNDGLINNWNGVQVWGDMHRYSGGLPQ